MGGAMRDLKTEIFPPRMLDLDPDDFRQRMIMAQLGADWPKGGGSQYLSALR
jgi:hypothetical protein